MIGDRKRQPLRIVIGRDRAQAQQRIVDIDFGEGRAEIERDGAGVDVAPNALVPDSQFLLLPDQ
jgi:hypothetical protein